MKTEPFPLSRALWIVLGVAAITVLIFAGLNMAIDPYGVRPSDALLRLPLKSRRSIEKNEYLHKAYALRNERPEVVYFGNSRVCVGLPADKALWQSKVYNCGLTAAGPEEILAYLRHSLSLGGVKHVVLGFDAVTFLGAPTPPPTFDASLLLQRPGDRMRPAFASPAIFSFDAVSDSLKTVLRQAGADVVTYQSGVRDGDAMRVKIKGDSAWASQKVLEAGREQLHRLAGVDPATDRARLACATEMAALCREHQVEVSILFLPIHHDYLELLETASMRERVMAVQKEVQTTFESAGLPFLAVHDLSLNHPLAADRQPEKEDSKIWKWWWEVSHFRAELGQKIVTQLATKEPHRTDPGQTDRALSRASNVTDPQP